MFVILGSNGPQKFCIEKVGKETWLPRSHTWYVENLTAALLPRLETSSDELYKTTDNKAAILGKFNFHCHLFTFHQLEFRSCQENKLFLVLIITAIYKA